MKHKSQKLHLSRLKYDCPNSDTHINVYKMADDQSSGCLEILLCKCDHAE